MHALHTDDHVPLHVREWAPATGTRGTVLLVHGLGEHIGRYEHVAAALNADGWRVVGHDHRGHGASGGARGALAREDDLLRDLAVVIDHAREGSAGGPLVLLGHSMGGLVAARFVAETAAPTPAAWHRPVDALVMTSPALDPGMNAAQKGLLAVLGPLAPTLALGNGLNPSWVSRRPEVVAAYQADPLVHDRVTPRLVRFIVDGGDVVRRGTGGWRTPTLLLWAGADRCVAPRGSAAFAARAPADVVTAREYPQCFHELMNEPERTDVLAEIRGWLQRLPLHA